MKGVRGLWRKMLVFFMLMTVMVSSLQVESVKANTLIDSSESENPFHIEIVPAENNSYEGDSQAGFIVKVSYSGEDTIQKGTVYLETVISDTTVVSINEETLLEKRQNTFDLTKDSVWEEKYSILLPKMDSDENVDYMVILKDTENSTLISENYQFSVKKSVSDLSDTLSSEGKTSSAENGSDPVVNVLRDYTVITGSLPDNISGLDKLYYGSVENDNTAPFHNAQELQEILENSDEDYARAVWEKYQYDLYDPNFSSRKGCGALYTPSGKKNNPDSQDRPDYADELLQTTGHEYPKDEKGPFHADVSSQIDSIEEGTLVNGALVSSDENAFENIEKTVSPDIGDDNTDREYSVDLKATANLKQQKPVVLLFQIQTSWQMFDLLHANALKSLVNGEKVTAELLSLYEMKQGFLDFVEWMEDNSDGSVMIGITNFQHKGTHSMFGKPYFTNNTNQILEGLYGWDSFGDCEHIHYGNEALKDAITELNKASNFTGWTDKNGTLIYDAAEMISIIIGGGCEANDLKTNSTKLPTVPDGVLKHQYGIRTNSGTGVIANDMISWMDYENQEGSFSTGKYYTDVVTREVFCDTLKDIYSDVQEKAPNEQKVTNVTVQDTITAEFSVKSSEIKAFIGENDVTEIVNISVIENKDGTTQVTCNFGTVGNKQEVHLQIPVQAKNDFIGSNNVYTNTGTPTISYNGRIDSQETYTQKFTDVPSVNVPIRFDVMDGQEIKIEPEQSIDLADLAKDADGQNWMTKSVEDMLDNYSQIEGTLTYQWVDENGNPVGDATTATIDSGHYTPPEIPSYIITATEQDVGQEYSYKLQVTFTPANVKEETTSKEPVSAQMETGEVMIEVTQKPAGKIRVKKIIDNYDKSLEDDEFMININSISGESISSQIVLNHDESSGYIEITEPTWLSISEILPMEYSYASITADGIGVDISDIQENKIYVERGDDITITIHNRYTWNPFFHTFDSIMNVFSRD